MKPSRINVGWQMRRKAVPKEGYSFKNQTNKWNNPKSIPILKVNKTTCSIPWKKWHHIARVLPSGIVLGTKEPFFLGELHYTESKVRFTFSKNTKQNCKSGWKRKSQSKVNRFPFLSYQLQTAYDAVKKTHYMYWVDWWQKYSVVPFFDSDEISTIHWF